MKSLKRFIGEAAAIRLAWWRLALFLGAVILIIYPAPGRAGHPAERTFRVEASRYAYSRAILKVNQGDRVTLELVSNDVVHGLAIDGYNLEVIADPGQSARLTFTADRSGTFRFRCSLTCGPMHPFMIGKIHIGESLLWQRAAGLALLAVAAILWRRF